jgi:hypothetical protein
MAVSSIRSGGANKANVSVCETGKSSAGTETIVNLPGARAESTGRRTPSDDRVNKPAVALPLAVAAISVPVGAAAWHHANQLLHRSRAHRIEVMLEPVAALLSENQAIIKELQMEFMAGGKYLASEIPLPNGFPGAVKVEIDAAR